MDLPFQEILKRTREGKLDFRDGEALNKRLAMELSISSAMDMVIVVQKKNLSSYQSLIN